MVIPSAQIFSAWREAFHLRCLHFIRNLAAPTIGSREIEKNQCERANLPLDD
jgi:hypothetical protein